jgi:hypothetical protein
MITLQYRALTYLIIFYGCLILAGLGGTNVWLQWALTFCAFFAASRWYQLNKRITSSESSSE